MCGICQEFQPWLKECGYPPAGSSGSESLLDDDPSAPADPVPLDANGAGPDDPTGTSSYDPTVIESGDLAAADPEGDAIAPAAALPVYTVAQISNYLREGFWSDYGGGRAFDVRSGDTLYVDLNGIAATGQALARQALQAWSDITGLIFAEIPGADPGPAQVETADAADDLTTSYALTVGEVFNGRISVEGDRDRIALTLSAGQEVSVTLTGSDWSGPPLGDPYLRVYNADGTLWAENDDSFGFDSELTLTSGTSRTVYLEAGAFGDLYTGAYSIEVVVGASASADIRFTDDNAGAFATYSTAGTHITRATVNVAHNWAGGENRIDGYHFQTYLHEIGHALGLGHAGPYNGSADYASDALYANDSWQMTVMSYFDQRECEATDADFAYVVTPQLADIHAAQSLYGTGDARAGDTVYGPDGTAGGYLDELWDLGRATSFTIWDAGGTDTLDFGSFSDDQSINLAPGAFSDIGGVAGALGIALGVVIEDAITGSGADTIVGNAANNHLSGGAGHDVLRGLNGVDELFGGAGDDVLEGGAGSDTLSGGDGRDLLIADGGANLLDGGAGGDVLIGSGVSGAELASLLTSGSDPLIDLWPDFEVA